MGIAVGKKCPACGCGGVISRFNKSTDRIQFDCSACDYRWTEPPLFLQELHPVGSGWTLDQEVSHLESMVEKYSTSSCQSDWEHISTVFGNGVKRLRTLIERKPSSYRSICDELRLLRRLIKRLTNVEHSGALRELTKTCVDECIARIEVQARAEKVATDLCNDL